MEQWEWWIGTVIVLFGAISGVSWQIGKVAKDSADRFEKLGREVATLQQELRSLCKAQNTPCPLHEAIEKDIEANKRLLDEHHQFHMGQSM